MTKGIYTDFWIKTLNIIKPRIDITEGSFFEMDIPELPEIGSRESYDGRIITWVGIVDKVTNKAVFNNLKDVIQTDKSFKTKFPGQLELRVFGNNKLNVSYSSINHDLILDRYKGLQAQNKIVGELYKWKLIQRFQDLWGQYESGKITFSEFGDKVDLGNLVFPTCITVFNFMFKNAPIEFESLLSDLFDERTPLRDRIVKYQQEFSDIYLNLPNHGKNTFQEERTIATLLSFRYPDKYALYKDTFYTKYCKGIGIKPKKPGEKLFHYYEIIKNFVTERLSKENDLLAWKDGILDESCYPDHNNLILAQDIFYCALDKGVDIINGKSTNDKDFKYWLFQCNPEQYDIVNEWEFRIQETWKINAHKNEIKPNDKVIVWVTGPNGGCYGLCTVTSEPYHAEELIVNLDIGHNLTKNPILKNELQNFPEFNPPGFYGGNQGTIFRATKEQYDKILEVSNKIINEKNMKHNNSLNTILYGPPGTGKTYHSINYAISIIEEKPIDQIEKEDRYELIRRYKQYNEKGLIDFVTFHQSFSYEDFVEGIKPLLHQDHDAESDASNSEDIGYEIKDGVFKQMCSNAASYMEYEKETSLGNYFIEQKEFTDKQFFKISLGNTSMETGKTVWNYCKENSCILIGWGGQDVDYTGVKSKKEIVDRFTESTGNKPSANDFNITGIDRLLFKMKKGDIVFVSHGNDRLKAVGKITGEYEFKSSKDINLDDYNGQRKVNWFFVDAKIPVSEIYQKKFSQQSIYKLQSDKINLEFFTSKTKPVQKIKNHVLIIDEINRGNISAIFGELITLLEADKRQDGENPMEVSLPYSKQKFSIPSNLYVVGTMNTADRSIALLDTALRRRFEFEEMMPDPALLDVTEEGVNLLLLLEKINERIEFLYDRDHTIGHSYFMGVKSHFALCDVFRNKIIPLLQEYFYNDWGKVQLVLADNPERKKEDMDKLILEKKYSGADEKNLFGVDLDEYEDIMKYMVNKHLMKRNYDKIPVGIFKSMYEEKV
ncbi:MAG: EVE domain-containing protein [Bacteroidales bacterium]|nr:EVE domain-containing protein [Bacteroidales bacterium]MCF8404482.1 EVE domain-containing protein [Bacteroidales bacterium]